MYNYIKRYIYAYLHRKGHEMFKQLRIYIYRYWLNTKLYEITDDKTKE